MTDQPSRELGLGQLGQAVYDVETQEWSFGRQFSDPIFYQPISTVQKLVDGVSAQDGDRIRVQAQQTPAGVSRHGIVFPTRVLSDPVVRALYGTLSPVSKAITRSLEHYDPSVGDLLAYGTIAKSVKAQGDVHVLVLPGGTNGESLKLIGLVDGLWSSPGLRVRSQEDYAVDLVVPTPDGEVGWWQGEGVPIRQICFSPRDDANSRGRLAQGALMAVRLADYTVIFRPIFRQSPVPSTGRLDEYLVKSSRIDANPLIAITPATSFGIVPADIAFNPWYIQQIAVADSYGSLVVMDLEYNKRTKQWVVTPSFGPFTVSDLPITRFHTEAAPRDDRFVADGWVRVVWIADLHTVAVCVRSSIRVISLQSGELLNVPNLGMKNADTWILDVRRHPQNPQELFILTTSHLLWLRVLSFDQANADRTFPAGANLLATFRHFRNPTDVTLQIHISEKERSMEILIFSRLNSMFTAARFETDDGVAAVPKMIGMPFDFNPNPSNIMNGYQAISFRPVAMAHPHGQNAAIAELASSGRIAFSCINFLGRDLNLHQVLVSSHIAAMAKESDIGQLLERQELVQSSQLVRQNHAQALNVFIVADDYIDGSNESSNADTGRFIKLDSTAAGSTIRSQRKAWSSRLSVARDAYNLISALPAAGGLLGQHIQGDGVQLAVASLKQTLNDRRIADDQTLNTLYQMVDLPAISDPRRASEMLSGVLSSVIVGEAADDPTLEIRNQPLQQIMQRLGYQETPTNLHGLYEVLIKAHLTKLPASTPTRYRVRTERECRQVAADLLLAGSQLCFQMDNQNKYLQAEAHGQSSQTTEKKAEKPTLFSSLIAQTQLRDAEHGLGAALSAYPTPSVSQASALSRAPSTTMQSHIQSLQRLVSFTTPPRNPPPQLARVLAHWDLGRDPVTYNYNVVQQAWVEAEEAAALEGSLTARQQRRLQRRADKELGRQRAQNARSVTGQSSQAAAGSASASYGNEDSAKSSQSLPRAHSQSQSQSQSQGQSQSQSQSQSQLSLPYRATYSGFGASSSQAPARKKAKKTGGFK